MQRRSAEKRGIVMRVILHCDCNSFFASAEIRDNPDLKNVPLAVGGNPETRKGIILAKNDIAKKYGVVTAETVWSAKKKCPELVVVPPRHERYEELSRIVNDIYKEYTEYVEPFGIDESWLDVTECRALFGSGEAIADELRRRIREETGLTISVGVSFNKAFAKLGSDYKKPDATTVIMPHDVESKVYPQSLGNLLYAGKRVCEEFGKYGIITIGDLARSDRGFIEQTFGKNGIRLYGYARGEDNERVKSIYDKEEVKSVGNSYTFPKSLVGEEEIRRAAVWLGDTVSSRMRRLKVKCTTLGVVIKDESLKSITRQTTLSEPTNHAVTIARCAAELIKRSWNTSVPIRMLGITASSLVKEGEEQISLFDGSDKKKSKLDGAIDSIRDKYGNNSLKFASSYSFDTECAKEYDGENN